MTEALSNTIWGTGKNVLWIQVAWILELFKIFRLPKELIASFSQELFKNQVDIALHEMV